MLHHEFLTYLEILHLGLGDKRQCMLTVIGTTTW